MSAASPAVAAASSSNNNHTQVTVHSAHGANRSLDFSPFSAVRTLVRHRHLLEQLTRREVLTRYRGSFLGVLWSVLNPLFMLALFFAVFGLIFRAKFTGHANEGPGDFALQLFAGLLVFNVFAECVTRAPSLMLLNTNYVTKVVFPLEILPATIVLNALVNLLVGAVPLLAGVWYLHGALPATVLLWPLLLLPIALLALGLTWLFAALGVFFRDLTELVAPLTQLLMYASAIFYSVEKAPPALQPILRINPLAFLTEQSRNLAVWGDAGLDWHGYGIFTLVGALLATLGYGIFQRLKHAFADVL
ncbi:MAG: ABC transporter permease [Verrucomicrobia bacterium]|nr:ABC transporter permease [Verrucomicrobiota bacterium]MBV9657079.1 ABC transporter permease [Verrucomicrobiota bacterium]